MKLHFFPGTVARAPLIALCEVKAEFTPIPVDFRASAQTGNDYLRVNPKGRVPSLETGSGILTETSAILRFIAAQYPAAGLMPDDPWHCAKVDELMTYLASTVHVAHAHKMRGHRWATQEASFEDMRGKVTQNMRDAAALVETDYLTGPWVLGDAYSIADPYLFSVACWLDGDGVPLDDFPKLAAHNAAMKNRPAVQQALQLEKGAFA